MSRNQRFTLLGIAAAIVVIAVVIAVASGGGDDKKSDSSGPTPAETTGQTQQAAPGSANPVGPAPQPDQPQAHQIVVEGGQPTGGVQKLKFKKGEQGELAVGADKAGEAHLHGYDIEKELEPGKTARFRF